MSDFDWRNGENVVVKSQAAVAVYVNDGESISIRQEADWPHEEDDRIIVVEAIHATRVAQAILAAAAELGEQSSSPAPAANDATAGAAERQRRYRKRHRNGNGNGNGRDGERDVTRVTQGVTGQ